MSKCDCACTEVGISQFSMIGIVLSYEDDDVYDDGAAAAAAADVLDFIFAFLNCCGMSWISRRWR